MRIHRRSFLAVSAALLTSLSLSAAEPKRVIVCTVTTGFRHSSIPFAEKTLQQLADESKAFTIVDFVRQPEVQVPKKPNKPRDPAANADDKAKARHAADMKRYDEEMAKWTPEREQELKNAQSQFDAEVKKSLERLSPKHLTDQKIDAVIFANTTGDLPLPDNAGFIDWIQQGHGFIGMHSASDTFHRFAPYIEMIGGEFLTHGPQVSADLIKADANHPATAGLPEQWDLKKEEIYEFKNHDRAKVRALWYLRHHPIRKEEMGYSGIAWCKMAGQGRVFYTALGHREDLWSADPDLKGRENPVETAQQFQKHILGGIKWALGLAEGSAKPNPEVK